MRPDMWSKNKISKGKDNHRNNKHFFCSPLIFVFVFYLFFFKFHFSTKGEVVNKQLKNILTDLMQSIYGYDSTD